MNPNETTPPAHDGPGDVRVPAVVTGVGPISAAGCGRADFWAAMTEGRHGFGPITLCDASESPSKIAAEVKDFRLERYVDNGAVLARRMPRPVQLAMAAAVLALHDAELDLDACDPNRLGVHVGTSLGNIEELLRSHERLTSGGSLPPHAAFHLFNHSAACQISSFFNIQGPVHTTTSGCNSGLDALGQSLRLIQSGAVDAMLVIGTDCEVVPDVLKALNASGSLAARYNDEPGRASRPFDRDRDGNVIGEGAAALLLEAEPHARARRARIYARLAGYQVASSGQNRQYSHDRPEIDTRPCVRAIRSVIDQAGWSPAEVDVVNANGSSSVLYDRIEATALAEVFGESARGDRDGPGDSGGGPRVHSIKSMLGQHGAGSSALQAVSACLAIRFCGIPSSINHESPEPEMPRLRFVTEYENVAPESVVVHSIGLGGFYYSAAAFEAVEQDEDVTTGQGQVVWSAKGHPRFRPTESFRKPLEPMRPTTLGSPRPSDGSAPTS
jgi:3-oxoacyl-[acyl-carrier-protein] synthase II